MPFIGNKPTAVPLTSADLTDGIITTAKIANDAVNASKFDETDNYTFTGTVAGAGEANSPSFMVRLSSDQSVSNSAQTKVQHNSIIVDTDNAYDNTTNYRFTVPSGKGGKYFLFACMGTQGGTNVWGSNSRLLINGTTSISGFSTGFWNTIGSEASSYVSAVYNLSVGDYVEHYARADANTGSVPFKAEGMSHGGWSTYFGGYKIST